MSLKKVYSIELLDTGALKEINNLLKPVKALAQKAIEERLVINPIAFGKPLRFTLKGYRRLRVHRYLIIYKIKKAANTVVIVTIKHSENIFTRDNNIIISHKRALNSVHHYHHSKYHA